MKRIILFLSIILPSIIFAQDTISFHLTTQDNIAVQTILNHRDTVDLMLHTAVSEVSLTSETVKKIRDLQSDGSVKAQSWGGESDSEFIKKNHLSIGDFNWDSVLIWVGKYSGPETGGKFGPNLFEGKILEINYDKKFLVIHPELPIFLQKADFQKFTFSMDRATMFLKGKLELDEEVYENSFMIHSGYGGTVLLDDAFANEHKLGEKLEIISGKELKDAYGNVIKTKKAFFPKLEIGGYSFTNIPVGFFEGSLGRQRFSVMGNGILKRFHIFLDQENGHIYMKPNSMMELPFKTG